MRFQHLTVGGFVTSTVLAVKLYVSSYSGTITTLELTHSGTAYSLSTISASTGLLLSPSALSVNQYTGAIYCTDENLVDSKNGSIAAYTSDAGKLTQISKAETMPGVVSQVVYNGGKALAVAAYGSSALQTFYIRKNGTLVLFKTFNFVKDDGAKLPPHPHEVIVDPTDAYVVVPDLGSNKIRVFSIDKATSALTEKNFTAVAKDSGPRHGAFLVSGDATYFFLLSETASIVTSYIVTYPATGGLTFTSVFTSGTSGNGTTQNGSAAAEAVLSPDKKFLLTSTRSSGAAFMAPLDGTNRTLIPMDAIQSWKIDAKTGNLAFVQSSPAGGKTPRQFSLNKDGTLAAVGLQSDGRVVIIERHLDSGSLGGFVAHIEGLGEVSSVIWGDE